MAKVVVIYESKYGNTKLVADAIAEGMKESGTKVAVHELKEVDQAGLTEFDAVIIGSPNHIGNATRSIRKFIDGLGKMDLTGKQVAVFDTHMGGDFEKAVKKMEKQLGQKAPALSLEAPGLSIRVDGMKGPLTEGELPKCRDFGVNIGRRLKA